MTLKPRTRARSRLKRIKTFRAKQTQKPLKSELIRSWIYLIVGSLLSSYIVLYVRPTNIRNIPLPDSYGPFLVSLFLAIYGFFKLILKSKVLSLAITIFLILIISLKLQGFRDIL